MTEPQDSTRPISVAELLAKNGTIGSPPVGGRRRRRRGNADSVTVAELTGEIPIISATEAPAAKPEPEPEPEPEQTVEPEPVEPEQPAEAEQEPADEEFAELAGEDPVTEDTTDEDAVDEDTTVDDDALDDDEASDVEADYAAHLEQRDVDPEPIEFTPPSRRPLSSSGFSSGGGAEQMSPDPLGDDDLSPSDDDIERDLAEIASGAAEGRESAKFEKSSSLLRSNSDTLFGGQSVADDLARRGRQPGPEDIDLGDDERDDETTKIATEAEAEPETRGSAFLRGAWVVAQCILAVAFGAGLFIAFDQLWKWNNIVALVLSVLVILGLVVGVRVVRKTEDIGSTLIAVAVGALVTLGPLALLQSN